MSKISRRDFGKLTAAGAATGLAGGAGAGSGGVALAAVAGVTARAADIPAPVGRRVVVVGGGWTGLTVAKYLKQYDPGLDVVLVERRAVFFSHPMSGAWIAGLTPLESIVHSYHDGAANNGYIFFNASLVDLDRQGKKAYTDQGWIAYDDLVLAPGIDYDYASFGVVDPADRAFLESRYPAGFVSGSEHLSLARKVKAFAGGIFLLTAPPGIYRCSATPYERACLIASVFKRDGIKGKVVLIDPRDTPAVQAEGFLAAFTDLYGDYIEYMPSTVIEAIDPHTRTVTTGFDEISFDDGAIYPRIRGALLLERLGLADPASAQMEASIDPFTYNARIDGVIDRHLYIAGDCRPMPFSKSGHTARTEGMYVAKLIAARARGEGGIPWESPHTICYSLVNAAPMEGIMVDGKYRFDEASGQWDHHENYAVNERDVGKGLLALEWAETHFQDMFY